MTMKRKQREQQNMWKKDGDEPTAKKVVEKVRYQITAVIRNEDAIEKEKEKFG